ncbi:DNA internalization-related competence protein ComEC/Rec2 [Vibrio sp. SCSIO 43136]|nr:DNA internalization-related competence protein ComEC/Rec2 [Vibrio sp. SCSIO 43136]
MLVFGVTFVIVRLRLARAASLALLIVSVHGALYQQTVARLFDDGQDITISGQIDSFFKSLNFSQQVTFSVNSINSRPIPWWLKPKLRLNWLKSEPLPKLGEIWQVDVHVQVVRARLNQTGFDKEAHYLINGWHATANAKSAQQIDATPSFRSMAHTQISQLVEKYRFSPYLLALTFADRSQISNEDWQGLRNSGLIHLLAISGLHIGLAFGIGWIVGRYIASVLPIVSPWSGFVIGLVFAFAYSWLAGFSLPSVRALVMCMVFVILRFAGLKFSPMKVLLVTLCIILTLAPFSALSTSFWLSFCAVAAIFIAAEFKFKPRLGAIKALIYVQLSLFVALLPISTLVYGGVSYLGILANLFAVPWVSLIVMPLVVLALITSFIAPMVAPVLWQFSDWALYPVLFLLPEQGMGWLPLSRGWAMLAMGVFVTAFCLFWRVPMIAMVVFILTLVSQLPSPLKHEPQLNIYDVGHGLSISLIKDGRAVLYDTGSAWPLGSYINSTVVPNLAHDGVYRIDGLIVSHFDSDHAGGLQDAKDQLEPLWIRASQYGYLPCQQGERWHWNGLDFEAIWPPKQVKRAYNPHSCVLQVNFEGVKILLAGDIDAISELLLLNQGLVTPADVVIVPHHGSQTSSTRPWVEAVNPSLAIASVGYRNHWGMPSQVVVDRYRDVGAFWLDTGQCGQIQLRMKNNQLELFTARGDLRKRWYRDALRLESTKFPSHTRFLP